MIQTAELVALVIIVVVIINARTILQFHLVQRAATRYWRRVSRGAHEKLFSDGARGKLRRRQWSKVVAAREQRKPS